MSVCGQIFVPRKLRSQHFTGLRSKWRLRFAPVLLSSRLLSVKPWKGPTFIHPSIHCRTLNQGRVVVAAGSAGCSRCPSTLSSSSWGGSWGVPGPDEIHNPSSRFWFCPGVSSQLVVPGKPPKGGAGGHPAGVLIRCSNHRFAELRHPPEETHFWLLVPEILFFRSLTMPVEKGQI